MHQRAVRVVHVERAARAALLPVRTEHEVVNNQLAFAVEKIRERHLPVRPVENVIFYDFDSGKLPAFGSESVALARELLLPGQQFFAGHKPFISRHYFRVLYHVRCHLHFSFYLSSKQFLLLRSFCETLSLPTPPARQ
jgi:hypothetical protein